MCSNAPSCLATITKNVLTSGTNCAIKTQNAKKMNDTRKNLSRHMKIGIDTLQPCWKNGSFMGTNEARN